MTDGKFSTCAICNRPLGLKGSSPAIKTTNGVQHRDCNKPGTLPGVSWVGR